MQGVLNVESLSRHGSFCGLAFFLSSLPWQMLYPFMELASTFVLI